MRWRQRRRDKLCAVEMFSWILLVALVAPGKVPQVPESALTYLNQALDLMQQNSINKKDGRLAITARNNYSLCRWR